MTWAAPWALLALVTLPAIWWWHRRRHRPRTVDLPSLLFLALEPLAPAARRQAFDAELWLALCAGALLALAAAGPQLDVRGEGHTVRVVVSGGAPAGARGYRQRVEEVLETITSALGSSDRLERVEEPVGAGAANHRPSVGALLTAARVGTAAWRIVVSDREAPAETYGVTWVSVGDPSSENVGIVAASLTDHGGVCEVFANVQGDATRPTRVRLAVGAEGGPSSEVVVLDLPPDGYAAHTFRLPGVGETLSVRLEAPAGATWVDDLAADDRVDWERRPMRVGWGDHVAPPLRRLVEDALVASLGGGALRVVGAGDHEADLLVTTATASAGDPKTWHLVLYPVPDGTSHAWASHGSDRALDDPLVVDLSTNGLDLCFAPGVVQRADEAGTLLLWRQAGARQWPVVVRDGRTVHFLPDPQLGTPSPGDSPLWPLFVDNLLREVAGTKTEGSRGYRRRGLLDAGSSCLGRTTTSLDLGLLADRPPDRAAVVHPLRPWLLAGAGACLLLLWSAPAWRRRPVRTGRKTRRSRVPSSS